MTHKSLLKKIHKNENGNVLVLAGPLTFVVMILIIGFMNTAYAWIQEDNLEVIAQNAAIAAAERLPWPMNTPAGNTPNEMVNYIISTQANLMHGNVSGTIVNTTYPTAANPNISSVTVRVTAPVFFPYIPNFLQGMNTGGASAETYTAIRTLIGLDANQYPIYSYTLSH